VREETIGGKEATPYRYEEDGYNLRRLQAADRRRQGEPGNRNEDGSKRFAEGRLKFRWRLSCELSGSVGLCCACLFKSGGPGEGTSSLGSPVRRQVRGEGKEHLEVAVGCGLQAHEALWSNGELVWNGTAEILIACSSSHTTLERLNAQPGARCAQPAQPGKTR